MDLPDWGHTGPPRFSRRSILKHAAVTTGLLSMPAVRITSGAQGDGEDLTVPAARAMLFDTDGDEAFETVMHLEDPTSRFCENGNEGREGVVHVTSDGEETRDYGMSIANVEDRALTLGDIADGATVAYDYFEGPHSENAAPDEAFVIVDWVSDDNGDDSTEQVTVAFQTMNDGEDVDGIACEDVSDHWQTRDVSAEMSGDGWGWRDAEVTREEIESGDALRPIGIALRDSDDVVDDLTEKYGEDTQLLAVGFGLFRTGHSWTPAYLNSRRSTPWKLHFVTEETEAVRRRLM